MRLLSKNTLRFAAVALICALLCTCLASCGKAASSRGYVKKDPSTITVCVDPGHGFIDPGASSEYLGELAEKDITLDISLKLAQLLRDAGYNVVMTREDDAIPAGEGEDYKMTPQMRAEFASALPEIDFFVSVHCNSYAADPTVNGTRLYYYAPSSEYTAALAKSMRDSIAETVGGKTPKTYSMTESDAFYVIKNVPCASVLVETLFVTNSDDAAKLLDETERAKMARGIFEGIDSYVKR